MQPIIRSYTELDYLEQHIVELLINEHDRDQRTAMTIINEYFEILKKLNDGHESANAFAKMFDDAYRWGTTGTTWLNNISK